MILQNVERYYIVYSICNIIYVMYARGHIIKSPPGLIKWKIKLKFTKTKNFSQFEFEPRTP
nr:MAG TPA: hypothetical protein [Caudoviricetes sp.]